MDKLREVFTAQEVADITRVNVLSVYRWIKEGRLKATKLGQWKIYRANLEEMLGADTETLERILEENKRMRAKNDG